MTAPTQAPPSTGGEYVVVPREPTEEMQRVGFLANRWTNTNPCGDHCIGRVTMPAHKAYEAMLAAAPTGYVPVKREAVRKCLALAYDAGNSVLATELRALLSTAPKDEAK